MAAIDPGDRPDPEDSRPFRPSMAPVPETPSQRRQWLVVGVVILVIAAVAAVVYLLAYGVRTGGGNGSGGGYFAVAFTGGGLRRLARHLPERVVARKRREQAEGRDLCSEGSGGALDLPPF